MPLLHKTSSVQSQIGQFRSIHMHIYSVVMVCHFKVLKFSETVMRGHCFILCIKVNCESNSFNARKGAFFNAPVVAVKIDLQFPSTAVQHPRLQFPPTVLTYPQNISLIAFPPNCTPSSANS